MCLIGSSPNKKDMNNFVGKPTIFHLIPYQYYPHLVLPKKNIMSMPDVHYVYALKIDDNIG
jgi:hypothetical protein